MKSHLKSMNWPAFFFSCLFVVYGLWNISNNIIIQVVMGSFGLFVEWEAQQVWGLSFTYEDWRNSAYKFQYLLYIAIFALIPGTGFFMTEIAVQETITQKIVQIESNNQSRIGQLNALIKQKTDQLSIEGQTKARTHYDKIQAKLDEYEAELKGLMSQGKTEIKVKAKSQSKDMFANASKALWGIPKETLIFIMFTAGLTMVYTGLMRKPIQFKIETKNEISEVKPLIKNDTNGLDNNVIRFQPLHDEETTVSHFKEGRHCQYSKCGGTLPDSLRADAKYCDDNCKLAAYRERLKGESN